MDVRLSAEQVALRESVVQVTGRLGPQATRDLDDAERQAKLDAAVDASGWRELRSPTEDGLPLASGVEAAIVAEELGRGLADAAFLGPVLAADLRRLARCASATRGETVALGADLRGPVTAGAEDLAVAVDTGGCEQALLLVGLGDTTDVRLVAIGPSVPSVDLTRSQAQVASGQGAAVTSRKTLAAADLDRWTALGLSLACADLVGIMRGATALATEYAKARQQYGSAIGSFQAVQHLLADALVATEGSHSVSRHAAWAVDGLEPEAALAAAASAKAYCARAARSVCEAVIQVHGGIGNTWDCLAHLYLRRALFSIDLLGGVGPSLDRVLRGAGIGGGRGLR